MTETYLEGRITLKSLAAPTPEDIAALKLLSADERKALLAEHLAMGRADIASGNAKTLETDDDIEAFFDTLWPVNETEAL